MNYKDLLIALGFSPKENTVDVFFKKILIFVALNHKKTNFKQYDKSIENFHSNHSFCRDFFAHDTHTRSGLRKLINKHIQ